MGGSKQQQTNQQQTSTTTQLPEWVTSAGQSLFNQAQQQKPVGAYTGQMTAGPSANQTAATAAARAGAGQWQGDLNTARAMTTAAASAAPANVATPQMRAAGYGAATVGGGAPQVAAGAVDGATFDSGAAAQYMNPYQQQVQADTLRTMDEQSAQDHASLNDGVQGAHAYGGTRQALLESELAKNQALQRTDYIDRSNSDAFAAAQGQFNTDRSANDALKVGNADRSLQGQTTNASLLDQLLGRVDTASQFTAGAKNTAANDNANRSLDANKANAGNYETMLSRLLAGGQQSAQIGESASNLNARDVANLSSTGGADQATDQAGLEATYQEYLRAGNAPLDNIKDIMAILSGAPRNVTTNGTSSGTATTTQQGSLLNQLLGAGQIAASAFSDRRLKTDIAWIDNLPNGLGVYRYRYHWDGADEPERIGVMADEVERIMPEALGPVVNGYATVDYSKLGGLLPC